MPGNHHRQGHAYQVVAVVGLHDLKLSWISLVVVVVVVVRRHDLFGEQKRCVQRPHSRSQAPDCEAGCWVALRWKEEEE